MLLSILRGRYIGSVLGFVCALLFLQEIAASPDLDGENNSKRSLWSLEPVRRPALPERNVARSRNPIDDFIRARLKQEHLEPSTEADRKSLIRRLSFDLLGLPPTEEEVDLFVNDRAPFAYEKLVDRLLASPRYGERWARHWLDVVRFAETHGFEMNQPRPNAWPYRDYVIRAFNEDKPYDRFVVEQIAGDAFGEDAATGFLVAGAWDQVKSPDEVLTKNQRADELHDIVSTTGTAFLGLTIGCARCHNHKFDPIPQRDYYAIKAIFEGVQHGERAIRTSDMQQRQNRARELQRELDRIEMRLAALEPLAASPRKATTAPRRSAVNASRNVDRFAEVEARYLRFSITETSDLEPCLDELEVFAETNLTNNLALAVGGVKATASGTYVGNPSHKLEHLNDGRYGNERSWISNERGKGWVMLEFPQVEPISRVVWSRDRSPERRYNDRVPTHYEIEVSANGEEWTTVASDKDRLSRTNSTANASSSPEVGSLLKTRKALEAQIKDLSALPKIYGGEFREPEPTRRFQRGDPMQPREIIAPAMLSAFGQLPMSLATSPSPSPKGGEGGAEEGLSKMPERRRRLELARWIASTNNPLTARVLVNRLWQYHFGEGLVSTPSDFGANGARPTHPELLDWLAAEFMTPSASSHAWSLKHVQRLIVTSATYRQASRVRRECLTADAGNRLLWRFSPRRLEAEAIRDSILVVSGRLDLRIGGPGWLPFQPNDNYVRVYTPKEKFGPEDFRRMIYATAVRQRPDGVFGAFDCPDGGQIAPHRSQSTTPLQALNLLNSGFTMQAATFFAERVERESGREPKAQVKHAFLLAFNRAPSAEEWRASTAFVREQGLKLFCRALLNANEFMYVF